MWSHDFACMKKKLRAELIFIWKVSHLDFETEAQENSEMAYSLRILSTIIHQIFSLARDWSKHVTWPNIPQLKVGNIRDYNPSNIFPVDILCLKSSHGLMCALSLTRVTKIAILFECMCFAHAHESTRKIICPTWLAASRLTWVRFFKLTLVFL